VDAKAKQLGEKSRFVSAGDSAIRRWVSKSAGKGGARGVSDLHGHKSRDFTYGNRSVSDVLLNVLAILQKLYHMRTCFHFTENILGNRTTGVAVVSTDLIAS